MSTDPVIRDSIDEAAATVGSLWPIHSFVTANPLSGFEDRPFGDAVEQAAALLGGRGYPRARTFRTALERGHIDRAILDEELAEAGHDDDPEALLDRMADTVDTEAGDGDTDTATDHVDRVLTKWLSAFLDEGSAHWPMPNRKAGFYAAFRDVAEYDSDVPDEGIVADLPDAPLDAIEAVVASSPEEKWVPILEEQLAALPGWTGFINRRTDEGGVWQSTYPISLEGYLAVRLALLDALDAPLEPDGDAEVDATSDVALAFLRAWEATYRNDLVGAVAAESRSIDDETADRPDAQLVFCIDTRSEVIRRHIESTGEYETHGYAGFFGVPMKHQGYDADVAVDACPPILDPQHRVTDVPTDDDTRARYDRWSGVREAADELVEILEANATTAYGYVETAGSGYGLSLVARTLAPGRVHDLIDAAAGLVPSRHEFCEPLVDHRHANDSDLPAGLTHEKKVEYAATAFELMGFEEFGRLVVFAGHASETANNPYDSSLDCGACAGNPGGPSARVLAAICNDGAVTAELRDRGFDIPEDTVFVAGQHNTTTDEVELFAGGVPESHADDLEQLRTDLATAREGASAERAESLGSDGVTGVRETERRAADWAETRPEWGLAGNAGFVVGPRELTSDCDLDGRAFLHSYDWSSDPDGDALEAILAGPMVVTQWINAQYYFSTVDNAAYGSGSKVTQNPVGNVGVYQGNGGDLMTGLPLQSLMAADDEPYHQPLRLSTVVHAPVERVTDVLADHEELTERLDNDWLSLTVVDPTRDHRAFHYEASLEWTPLSERTEAAPETPAQAVADD